MKELEKVMEQLVRENNKIEKAQNRAKQLNQKISKLKRSAETKRKVQKGGVFEVDYSQVNRHKFGNFFVKIAYCSGVSQSLCKPPN